MEELRIKIEQLIEDLENETANRNMNDLEESRYKTLCEVLDLIDEQKKWRFLVESKLNIEINIRSRKTTASFLLQKKWGDKYV